MEQRCIAKVYPKDQWGSYHPYQCSKKGTVERDGKWYCKVHDPEYRKAKIEARLNRMNAQFEAAKKQRTLEAASKDMYKALKLFVERYDEYNAKMPIELSLPFVRAGNALNKAEGKGE